MNPEVRMWTELIFNSLYLIVVWGVVIAMTRRMDRVRPDQKREAVLFRNAFLLLAFGDTFHVGSRNIAYFLENGLDTRVSLFQRSIGLVGGSALVTALTVSIFYLLMLWIWKVRYERKWGALEWILVAAFAARIVLLLLPQNQWNEQVPVQPWGALRNIPLIILGLGTAVLILISASQKKDRSFLWIGIMILISYACYMPVVFFVQEIPLLGMLMIPKTMAYVAIAFLGYFEYFATSSAREGGQAQG